MIDIGNVNMKQVFDGLKVFWGDKHPWGEQSKNGCIQWDDGNQVLEIF
jgi:hypothetical protein